MAVRRGRFITGSIRERSGWFHRARRVDGGCLRLRGTGRLAILIRREAVAAPKDLLIAVPAKFTPDAIKPGSPGYAVRQAYFVNSTLASTNGGYMGHFPEARQEADALAAQLAVNSQLAEGEQTQAQNDAGSDDDGGSDTPLDAQLLSSANSNKIEINSGGAQGKPQILETVLKPIVAEKISDLLIANGYRGERAGHRERRGRAAPRADPAAGQRRSGGWRSRRRRRLSR